MHNGLNALNKEKAEKSVTKDASQQMQIQPGKRADRLKTIVTNLLEDLSSVTAVNIKRMIW